MSLKEENQFYVFTIKGFETEKAAKQFVGQLWMGLRWWSLNHGLDIKATTELQQITYTEEPLEAAKNLMKSFSYDIDGKLHGLFDGTRPAIYPTERTFGFLTFGKVTVTTGTNSSVVFQLVSEGIRFHNSEAFLENVKLQTALDLYAASFEAATQNAKFLSLIMALETLAEGKKRPKMVLDLLTDFETLIESKEKEVVPNSDEADALDSLKRELCFRQENSIRSQIRTLVYNSLSENGDNDAIEVSDNAKKLYDKRSTLVHNGSLPAEELNQAINDIRTIVKRVLQIKFLATTKLQE